MYYETFQQYIKHQTENYTVSIKDEGGFCRVIPRESMSVGEFRSLFVYLNSIEDINAHMNNPEYITVEHDI